MGLYDTSIGTLLIGIFFNTYLYGLVTYQFLAYYKSDFGDRLAIKYMVLFLFILDTIHSATSIYLAWMYCVENWGNPSALTVAFWPYTFTPIATALAALVTQIFLGYRVWRLSNSKILFGVIIALAVPSFALGMACGIKAWIIRILTELPQINNLVTAWLAMQVGCDAVITGTLTIILSRSRTGFRKTDTVLNRLIRGAIQTGLFAGIFSLGDLISFLSWPDTNLYGMFAVPIGRIYTNTLLDTLLARTDLKAKMAGTYDVGSSIGWAPSETARNIQLEVRKEVHQTCDNASFDAEGKVPPTMAI
ncbi:hypothetical protein BJ138DRAFT_1117125 [Hygrophoropsis aurantiaca]|uniref:Uncharacterized protein n=1 Tax=Hygrophoropsis aurantiaca TaxID=72124 RepID=A0ACB8A194_9AGAM|nr:hypothetical protein BJ138DRAFT_1117125 [Hygrophoropsis aurantiaca]